MQQNASQFWFKWLKVKPSVPRSGRGGRKFESCHPDFKHFAAMWSAFFIGIIRKYLVLINHLYFNSKTQHENINTFIVRHYVC